MALSLKKDVTSTRLNAIRDKQIEKQHADELQAMKESEARLKKKEAAVAELKVVVDELETTSNKESRRLNMRKARKLLRTFKVIDKGLPLQIGIVDELLARRGDIPEKYIKIAMRERVGKPAYLAKLAEGGKRYSLDGEPVGEITPEHQKHAAEAYIEKQKED